MDTQFLLLLCVPLVVAAVAFVIGLLALRDITFEGMGDASKETAEAWENLFMQEKASRLKDYAGKVDEYLRQIRADAKKRGLRTNGYVMDRIETICRTLDPRNRVRKVPSLSDLRGLSQQREQSCFSASLFRSLVPSILVLGIGCTLFGVHDVLSHRVIDDQIMMLGEALCPGALAVVGTIVLFALRGEYNKKYASLIRALDKLTLDCLLPHFQEPDPTLHSLNEYVRQLNASVGGGTEQGKMNLKEGVQKFRGALMQWSEVSDGCMKALTHAAGQMCSIGKDAQDIQEKDGDCFRKVRKMLGDIQMRTGNRCQSAQTLLKQTYPVLLALRELLLGTSKKTEVGNRNSRRLTEQKRRFDPKSQLLEMRECQADLRKNAEYCDQLIQWLRELPIHTEEWGKRQQVDIHTLCSHLTKQQKFIEAQIKELSELSESCVDQTRQAADKNAKSLCTWISQIGEHAEAYVKIIREQDERCRKVLSGSLYPVGRWGIYMRVADTFCRVRWLLYAIVFILMLILI